MLLLNLTLTCSHRHRHNNRRDRGRLVPNNVLVHQLLGRSLKNKKFHSK